MAVEVAPSPAASFDHPADLVVLDRQALDDPAIQARVQAALASGQRVAIACQPGDQSLPDPLSARVRCLERPLRARHLLALEPASLPAAAVRSESPRLPGLRILAAEDNEINRLVLGEMLESEGALLVCAENGREAVERVQESSAWTWDIVLMDIQMPDMDGYEATRRIRALDPDLPVIGLTAHAMAEERERCLAAGMVAHLTKPVQIERLVTTLLRHRRVRPAASSLGTSPLTAKGSFSVQDGVNPVPSTAPTPLPTVAQPIIDWAVLDARYPGQPAFIDRLAGLVLRAHGEDGHKLRAARADEDLAQITFLAHTLKGMAGNLIAHPLQELALRTEQAARGGRREALRLAEELAAALEGLLDEVSERTRRQSGERDG
jgi:CheY-like chemotaxis protein